MEDLNNKDRVEDDDYVLSERTKSLNIYYKNRERLIPSIFEEPEFFE